MKPEISISAPRRGFALPMTILVVVSLLIMVIGLIAMLSLERKTARSYSHAARAEMALDSGLNDAMTTLGQITSRDDSLVFRMEDPDEPLKTIDNVERQQFFTYGSVFQNNAWRVIPLFSGLQEKNTTPVTSKPNSPNTDTLKTDLKSIIGDIKTLGRMSETDLNIPRAKWVELPRPASAGPSELKVRYAWWVEDLSGRIDGRTNGSQPRKMGLNTNELGVYTIFKNNEQDDPIGGPEDELVKNRLNLLTAASSRIVLSPDEANKITPYLTYSLAPANPNVEPLPVIPQGFGYADAGGPMMDLNEAVTGKDVDGLSAMITRNLPGFTSDLRVGGFKYSGQDYTKTLAANIIDYADTDSDATKGTSYRGVDCYPFVNEMYDRYEWLSSSSKTTVDIKVSTYIELWNPNQIKTPAGKAQFENVNIMAVTIPPGGQGKFSTVVYPVVNVPEIAPNGFWVGLMGEKTYNFPRGAFEPGTLTFATQNNNNFKFSWNGIQVDTTRGGVRRQGSNLTQGASNRKWKGNGSPAQETTTGQAGDPRATPYIGGGTGESLGARGYIYDNTYASNTSWGGRSLKRGISSAEHNEVKVSTWPDRGSDSTAGNAAGDDGKLPTAVIAPLPQPKMAPNFISNAGYYVSPAELGNIFDPSQWQDVEKTSSAANSEAGGGYTLAIGRPEFGQFDKEGRRSAQLLDLFYAKLPGPVMDAIPVNSRGMKINVNTASREVLRTLVAGVKLEDDPQQNTLRPPSQSIIGDLFADAVIATRNYAPLRGPSDLALVKADPTVARNYATGSAKPLGEPFFGSRFSYQTGAPPNTWDDAGREELFRKVINMVSFQGKTFRIVVAGEVVDNVGNVVGKRTKEVHVMFEPERDNTGALVVNGTLKIRKLYEKSF